MSSATEGWFKSSYSAYNGNCLEARWCKSSHSFSDGHCLEWRFRKSSHSQDLQGHSNCAEAALRHGTVQVRDSRLGDASPVLSFSPAAWDAFLRGVKAA